MARAGSGKQQVELLDADAVAAPAPPSRGRRPRLWWAAALAALVVALLAVQSVADARHRTTLDRLSALPGVVRPVEPPVGVRWAPQDGAGGRFFSGAQVASAVVAVEHGSDGSHQVVALDELTGERRWSVPVIEGDGERTPTVRGVPLGGCQDPQHGAAGRDRHPGETAVCLVGNGYVEHGTEPPTLVPPTRSFLLVLDARTGRLVAQRAAPRVTSFAALPGLVVTARPTDAGLDVVATDLRTGTVRWRHAEPSTSPALSRGAVFVAGEQVGVWMPPGRVTLLDRDGAVLRSGVDAGGGYAVDPSTGEVTVSTIDRSGRPVSSDLHAPAALTYPGFRTALAVDDGSVPGLVLTSGPRVQAFDRDTGEHRWTLERSSFGRALVLLGRVYLMTPKGLVAVDGASGEIVWSSPVPPDTVLRNLFTDGGHVLATFRHGATTELVAFEPAGGTTVWRSTLPDGIDSVAATGHLLLGFTRGTPSVLG